MWHLGHWLSGAGAGFRLGSLVDMHIQLCPDCVGLK